MIVICLFSVSAWAEKSAPSGGYFLFRGGYLSGSLKKSDDSLTTSGALAELSLGARLGSFIKLGFLGTFENLLLWKNSENQGTLALLGYGGEFRLFFLDPIFISGGGGMTQTNFREATTENVLVAMGQYYFIGTGLEFEIQKKMTLEFGIRNEVEIFPLNEFKDMKSVGLFLGINMYF